MKILLTISTVNQRDENKNHEYLKLLIEKGGADIRFKDLEENTRIALVKNELLISMSSDNKKLCNSGLYYCGHHDGDVLLDAYRDFFYEHFNSGRKIGVKTTGFITNIITDKAKSFLE